MVFLKNIFHFSEIFFFDRKKKVEKMFVYRKILLMKNFKNFEILTKIIFSPFSEKYFSFFRSKKKVENFFFHKNPLPPTSPETYPKHSFQLHLSSENELFKVGPQKSRNSGKKLSPRDSQFRGRTHVCPYYSRMRCPSRKS